MTLWNGWSIKLFNNKLGHNVYDKEGKPLYKHLVENADPKQADFVEGGAYDLRGGTLYKLDDHTSAVIPAEQGIRITPEVSEVAPWPMETLGGEMGWILYQSEEYLIETVETVNVPVNAALWIHPRTTLFRSGLELTVGVARPNYQGTLTFKLANRRNSPAFLSVGARIASFMVETFETSESDLYQGQWQGGIVSTDGEKVRAY